MRNIILGINCVYHESSVCLIIDNKVVAAIEEERLSRVKHAKESKIDNPDELPILALNKCLEMGGIRLEDVSLIGFSFLPERRLENIPSKDRFLPNNWGCEDGEKLFYDKVVKIPQKLQEMGFKGEFSFIEHAIAHCASAYYPSTFNDAAILSIDGIGEFESTTLAYGNGKKIDVVQQLAYPNSIGFLWEKISKFLGFSEYDACKVMSVASFGNSSRFEEEFKKIISINDETIFELDNEVLCFRVEDYSKLETLFKIKKRESLDELEEVHKDIAASLQKWTTDIIVKIFDRLYEETKSENLCIAGGVALNCVTNTIAFENSKFKNIFIQPAANDAGTALGAALKLNIESDGNLEGLVLDNTFLGPSFTADEIHNEMIKRNLVYSHVEDIEVKAAELITAGNIIGWFQGAMEFGPRALGNRSLLADPRNFNMIKKLNSIVKHREDHRPFCPSVLSEETENWFEIKKHTPVAEYMLMAYPALSNKKELIPAVVHVDGTSRIQAVNQKTNPKYHELISEFYKLTGIPMVLNTSFNDREPIVCTPEDAIKTFLKSNIDYLVMGNFILNKKDNLEKV